MGIKGIRQFLRKTVKDFENTITLEDIKGKSIAIDASFILYSYKASSNNYLPIFLRLFKMLKDNDNKILFVFDGKRPAEKDNELKKRKENKNKNINILKDIENDLKYYINTGEKSNLINNIVKISNKNNKVSSIDDNIIISSNVVNKVNNYIIKEKNKYISLNTNDFNNIKIFLKLCNIQYITAMGEAELCCVKLNELNIVDFIYTKDTDVIALSCENILSELTINGNVKKINMDNILKTLEISKENWLDICIMCGTDFNDNIYGIGPSRSLLYIKRYKKIENIPIDISSLNYKITRKIFTSISIPNIKDINLTPIYFKEKEIQMFINNY